MNSSWFGSDGRTLRLGRHDEEKRPQMMITRFSRRHTLALGAALLLAASLEVQAQTTTLLNVSYDPTREFYQDFNAAFAKHWKAKTGSDATIKQSHGGSGKQARAVIDGLEADVVTLALAYDIDALDKNGGLHSRRLAEAPAQQQRTLHLHDRVPGAQGQPEGDQGLERSGQAGVEVITPNPKTSGGARWNYLAAWGYALQPARRQRGHGKEFVTRIYKNVRCSTRARAARPRPSSSAASATSSSPGRTRRFSPSRSLGRTSSRSWCRALSHPGRAAGCGRGQGGRQAQARARWRQPISSISTRRRDRRSPASTSTVRATPRLPRSTPSLFAEGEPVHHRRRVRRLGQGAEGPLRRRRDFRPDLQQMRIAGVHAAKPRALPLSSWANNECSSNWLGPVVAGPTFSACEPQERDMSSRRVVAEHTSRSFARMCLRVSRQSCISMSSAFPPQKRLSSGKRSAAGPRWGPGLSLTARSAMQSW